MLFVVKNKAKPVEIKASYLGTVSALETWAAAASLTGELSGL
jgi:hypothetical protein